LTLAGHVTNNDTDEPAATRLNLGSRQNNWRWNIMVITGSILLIFVLGLSLQAFFNGLFRKVIRLSSHGSLISHHTNSFKDDAIDGDVHSISDFDQITDLDKVSVERLLF